MMYIKTENTKRFQRISKYVAQDFLRSWLQWPTDFTYRNRALYIFQISIVFEAENCSRDVNAEPSDKEKNDNVLNFERSDYDSLPQNCFLEKKVLTPIVNDNTAKSQTIEPLDHKDIVVSENTFCAENMLNL